MPEQEQVLIERAALEKLMKSSQQRSDSLTTACPMCRQFSFDYPVHLSDCPYLTAERALTQPDALSAQLTAASQARAEAEALVGKWEQEAGEEADDELGISRSVVLGYCAGLLRVALAPAAAAADGGEG